MTEPSFLVRDYIFGEMKVYREYRGASDKFEYTVYMKTPEDHYRFFVRDEFRNNGTDEKEVDWRGYILGARSLRLDFEAEETGVEEPPEKELKAWIIEQVQKDFDEDNIFGFHVQKIEHPPEWDEMTDEELWEVQRANHKRLGDLEVQVREERREHRLLWALGDRKFNWYDRL